jgi:hypothetical protein
MAKVAKPVVRLPDDATVRSLVGEINDPAAYVRAVMRNMPTWDVVVRIDTASDAKRPAYYLEEVTEADEESGTARSIKRGWCDGRHKPLDGPLSEASAPSSVAMTRYEIQCLLADILEQPHPKERHQQVSERLLADWNA